MSQERRRGKKFLEVNKKVFIMGALFAMFVFVDAGFRLMVW